MSGDGTYVIHVCKYANIEKKSLLLLSLQYKSQGLLTKNNEVCKMKYKKTEVKKNMMKIRTLFFPI